MITLSSLEPFALSSLLLAAVLGKLCKLGKSRGVVFTQLGGLYPPTPIGGCKNITDWTSCWPIPQFSSDVIPVGALVKPNNSIRQRTIEIQHQSHIAASRNRLQRTKHIHSR